MRKRLGLTQQEMAALLHRSRPTIARWEGGEPLTDGLVMAVLAMLDSGRITPDDLRAKNATRSKPAD
jgi:DNA-binding transcriptional regulator YiaG